MAVALVFLTVSIVRADEETTPQACYKIVEYTVMVPTWATEKRTIQVTQVQE